MVKDIETTKQPEEEPVLSEWQKRNQEFLKKKAEEKAEQEEVDKRLRELKRSQVLGDVTEKEPKTKPSKYSRKSKKQADQKKKAKSKKIKKVRKKDPHRNRFVSVLSLATVVFLLSMFMVSPLSKSKEIMVSGQQATDLDTIIKDSGIKAQDYVTQVFWQRDQIAKKIVKANPWLESAKIRFHLPNRFTILVKEYDIIAYRQQNASYQPILSNGVIIDQATQTLPDAFLSVHLDKAKDVSRFIKAKQSLKQSIQANIQSVSREDSKSTTDLVKLTMYDGNTVLVPLSKMAERLPYYPQVARHMLTPGIIDMEVGIYIATEEETSSEDSQEDKENTESDSETGDETSQVGDQSQTDPNQQQQGQSQETPVIAQ